MKTKSTSLHLTLFPQGKSVGERLVHTKNERKSMKTTTRITCPMFAPFALAVVLVCASQTANATDHNRLRLNQFGSPVLGANGHHINYDRKSFEEMARRSGDKKVTHATAVRKSLVAQSRG